MKGNITNVEIKSCRRAETERSDKIIYAYTNTIFTFGRLHKHDIYICDNLCGNVISILFARVYSNTVIIASTMYQ